MFDPTFSSILVMLKRLTALFLPSKYEKIITKSRDGSNCHSGPSCSPLKMVISVEIMLDRYCTLPLHMYSSVCLSQCIVTSLFGQKFESKTQVNYVVVAFQSNHYNHFDFR